MDYTIKDKEQLNYSDTNRNVFRSVFDTFPSVLERDIRKDKFPELISTLKQHGFECFYTYDRGDHQGAHYMNRGETMILFTHNGHDVELLYTPSDKAEVVKTIIKDTPENERIINGDMEINILTKSGPEFRLKDVTLGYSGDIELHYNEDFYPAMSQGIVDALQAKQGGILLLHGEPGTGKTSYIRYLTSKVPKKFIVVPDKMIPAISSPEFLYFLLDYPKCVLVMEDAEMAIKKRTQGHSHVGELLNLSDGLIGQALQCSVIATFNAKLTDIDDALKRDGRLLGEYEFKALEISRANALAKKLGIEKRFTSPTPLATVFNANNPILRAKEATTTIGFNINKNKTDGTSSNT